LAAPDTLAACVDPIRFYAGVVRGDLTPGSGHRLPNRESWVRWEPLGVVAAIVATGDRRTGQLLVNSVRGAGSGVYIQRRAAAAPPPGRLARRFPDRMRTADTGGPAWFSLT
jgi:hypothetical protein